MKEKLSKIFLNYRFILVLFVLLALVVSIQSYFLGTKHFGDLAYNHYNNYEIFKHSFSHLVDGMSLYVHYPEEHIDLYKYSPTFALFFGVIAWMPYLAGIITWNLLNALVLLLAFKQLPGIRDKYKVWMLFIVLHELVGSMQNQQSNALMAGLIILAFGLLENKKYALASLMIVSSVFIKIFGIVALALFIFYPKKLKLIGYTTSWTVLLLAAPLLVTSFSGLLFQYKEWGIMLANDHSASLGISFFGWLQSWFNISVSKNYLLAFGAFLFLIPMFLFQKHNDVNYRLKALASILIWVIIFNHKAESPTFIIAMSGISIYLFTGQFNNLKLGLLLFSLLITSIIFMDFIPRSFRTDYLGPLNIKVFPSIIIWFLIIWDMLFRKKQVKAIDTHEHLPLHENS